MTWSGSVRGALAAVPVYPTTAGGGLPVWEVAPRVRRPLAAEVARSELTPIQTKEHA